MPMLAVMKLLDDNDQYTTHKTTTTRPVQVLPEQGWDNTMRFIHHLLSVIIIDRTGS